MSYDNPSYYDTSVTGELLTREAQLVISVDVYRYSLLDQIHHWLFKKACTYFSRRSQLFFELERGGLCAHPRLIVRTQVRLDHVSTIRKDTNNG